ncbi:GNAT family N-acetyltransferase [Streptomyces spongiae]|uniref:Uncharacterized protein n=1 Tax=Streptomyces spongiae TaxID=565072 RepID=A0A5N8X941_9ACTN|nr:hypothetical protein [Streptomyces spongiae]MPY55877.1 hypothetical protein [Streptomyces spongiae]
MIRRVHFAPSTHGPVVPAQIRSGEQFGAEVAMGSAMVSMRVWRLSPFAIDVEVPAAVPLVGKAAPDATPESMADADDARSRIFMLCVGGQLVATSRAIFHPDGAKLEHERYVPSPPGFPTNDELVEASRVATHPDFRRSDLLFMLLKHMLLVNLQAGRRWTVGSATEKLVPLYKRIGAHFPGVTFELATLNNEKHHLFMLDLPALLRGRGVSPLVWNYFFEDPFDFARIAGVNDLSAADRLRMRCRRLLRPLVMYLRKRRSKASPSSRPFVSHYAVFAQYNSQCFGPAAAACSHT